MYVFTLYDESLVICGVFRICCSNNENEVDITYVSMSFKIESSVCVYEYDSVVYPNPTVFSGDTAPLKRTHANYRESKLLAVTEPLFVASCQ